MTFKCKFKNIKKFYKIFIVFVIFFNTILISKLNANSFKINEIEVSEDFNLDFNKKKVFDKAFKLAFFQLISTVVVSKDIEIIEKTSLSTIKSLIDSFTVSDEKFFENKYYAKFNVNFNKKKAYNYFESKNIFPSIPKKLNLLFLPVLINSKENELVYFGENPIYKNWNNYKESSHLLNYILPAEDIEDMKIFNNNIESIEEYNFEKIVRKYDLENYIILIIYQNQKEINVLSKLQLNNSYKIFNISYKDIDIGDEKSILKLISDLKNFYEDEWKKLNLINTSIQLPLTLSLSSKNYDKIKLFEKTLDDLDLVSSFVVLSFNNENIFYKVIYNGSPDKFFNEIEASGLNLEKNNQTWKIQ
jgi:hypothetical protein